MSVEVPSHIKGITPYNMSNVAAKEILKLDLNESPIPLPQAMRDEWKKFANEESIISL